MLQGELLESMVLLFVPSILSQLCSSMSRFDETCMIENELVREISRGKVVEWIHPRQPDRKGTIIMAHRGGS